MKLADNVWKNIWLAFCVVLSVHVLNGLSGITSVLNQGAFFLVCLLAYVGIDYIAGRWGHE